MDETPIETLCDPQSPLIKYCPCTSYIQWYAFWSNDVHMEDTFVSCDFFSHNIPALHFYSHNLEHSSITHCCEFIGKSDILKTTVTLGEVVQCKTESIAKTKLSCFIFFSLCFLLVFAFLGSSGILCTV